MSDGGNIIDFASRRLAAKVDAPTALRRKAHDYLGCSHRAVLVDADLRTVECEDCKVRLDPVEVLLEYANEERRFAFVSEDLIQQQRRLRDEVELLKRERANLKATNRRSRKASEP